MGIGDDSPLHQAIIALPPDEIGPQLIKLSKEMLNHTGEHLRARDSLDTRLNSNESIAADKNATALAKQGEHDEAVQAYHNLDNTSKEKIKDKAVEIALLLQKNKALTTDQLVAQSIQEYEKVQSPENLAKYQRALKAKQDTSGVSGKLIEAYMNGELTEKFLPQATNTRENPQTSAGTNFPVNTQMPAATPMAPNVGVAPIGAPPQVPSPQGGVDFNTMAAKAQAMAGQNPLDYVTGAGGLTLNTSPQAIDYGVSKGPLTADKLSPLQVEAMVSFFRTQDKYSSTKKVTDDQIKLGISRMTPKEVSDALSHALPDKR
jgi:hypothetical protein